MLRKELNPVLMTALVIGATVGSGIFVLPGSLAESAGPASIISFLLAAFGSYGLAYVFAELGIRSPVSNGLYEYPKQAFGDMIGAINGWCYWIFMWSGISAVLIGLMGYLALWWPALADNGWLQLILGTILLWIFTFINTRKVEVGATWGLVFTIIKVGGLIVLIIVGLFHIDFSNFAPFMPTGSGSIIPTMALLFWSFVGIETAVTVGEEADDPKTIRKSTFNALFTIIIVYGLTLFVAFGAMPSAELAESQKPLSDLARLFMGDFGAHFIAIIAVCSIVGVMNNTILLTGRTSYAIARDGLFPQVFSKTNKYGVPSGNIILGSVLANILLLTAVFNTLRAAFDFVLLFSTLFCLIPYVFTMVSMVILYNRKPEMFHFEGSQWTKVKIMAVIGFVFSGLGIWGAGADALVWALVFIVIMAPVFYAFVTIERDRLKAKKTAV